MNRSRVGRTLAALVVSGLVATACSDSGTDARASADTKSAAEPGKSAAPIKIGFIGTTEADVFAFPQTAAAAEARVKAANAAGGVDGRKLELVTCNDANDPNKAAACVRQAVDAGVVAVIGGLSQQGDTITGGLAQAGVIYTGHRPLGPGDYSSPVSFPLVGGSASTAAGLGLTAVKDLKCQHIVTITGDAPGNRAATKVFDEAVKSSGGAIATSVVTPSNTTDYSPAGASAAGAKADCILLMMTPPEIARATPAVRKAAGDAVLLAPSGAVPPQIVEALGKTADGIVLADSQLPVSDADNEAMARFRDEMSKFGGNASPDSFGLTSWLAVDVVIKVASGLDGKVDAKTIREAFEGLASVDSGGILGDFGFTELSPVPERPRQFNRTYIISTIRDGDYVIEDRSFKDATKVLSS